MNSRRRVSGPPKPVVVLAYDPVTGLYTEVQIQNGRVLVDADIVVPATWHSEAVSGNTNGDNQLVAAPAAGQRIYIMAMTLIAQGDVDIVLESGVAGPDLTGAMSMAVDGNGFVWPVAGRGWWARTEGGASLNMRLSAAVFVTGIVTYYIAP